MKIPRNFSLGLAGLLFTAWMTWAVKPRYQVYQVWSNVEHETSWEFYIIKNEVPHVPFVRSIERSYFTIGGPVFACADLDGNPGKRTDRFDRRAF